MSSFHSNLWGPQDRGVSGYFRKLFSLERMGGRLFNVSGLSASCLAVVGAAWYLCSKSRISFQKWNWRKSFRLRIKSRRLQHDAFVMKNWMIHPQRESVWKEILVKDTLWTVRKSAWKRSTRMTLVERGLLRFTPRSWFGYTADNTYEHFNDES